MLALAFALGTALTAYTAGDVKPGEVKRELFGWSNNYPPSPSPPPMEYQCSASDCCYESEKEDAYCTCRFAETCSNQACENQPPGGDYLDRICGTPPSPPALMCSGYDCCYHSTDEERYCNCKDNDMCMQVACGLEAPPDDLSCAPYQTAAIPPPSPPFECMVDYCCYVADLAQEYCACIDDAVCSGAQCPWEAPPDVCSPSPPGPPEFCSMFNCCYDQSDEQAYCACKDEKICETATCDISLIPTNFRCKGTYDGVPPSPPVPEACTAMNCCYDVSDEAAYCACKDDKVCDGAQCDGAMMPPGFGCKQDEQMQLKQEAVKEVMPGQDIVPEKAIFMEAP